METIGVLLGDNVDIAVQLKWACRLADASEADLLVLLRVESPEAQVVEIDLEAPQDGAAPPYLEVASFVREAVGVYAGRTGGETEEPPGGTKVRLKEIRCPDLVSLRQLLLAEVRSSRLKKLTIVRDELTTNDAELVRERRAFLRHAPCEVVFCYGLHEGCDVARILVAIAGGPHGSSALRLAADLAAVDGGAVTALRVNPSVGQDAEGVGERRLRSSLRGLGVNSEQIEHRVVIDDQIYRGVRRVWEEGRHDLVVLGASRLGILGSQIGRGISGKLLKGESRPVVVIVSAASPVANRLLGLVEGGIELLVPQIDRDDRIALVDRVQSSFHQNFDFLALMVLSTIIAAIGLIQNSAAVVIGAMLVAPMMTPLLGLALALMQGNPHLARISIRLVLLGLVVSMCGGALVGWLTPGFAEPTREMLGRGGPGMLDLLIAFASGIAAAYASSRPGLVAALPGVAIAAALVPPIATCGLAFALGDVHLAGGALFLFVINMLTIVLASMMTLWLVGVRSHKRLSRWTILAGSSFVVSVAALAVVLSLGGRREPLAVEVPDDLPATIREQLGGAYRLDSVAVAYDELGAQLVLRISGQDHIPELSLIHI